MQRSSADVPHLSTLEQISPQAYVRFILCFGLPSGFTHDELTRILCQSLEATAAKIPVLNCLVVSVTDSHGRETKDLRQGDGTMFNVKDLTGNRMDFGTIRSKGFPSHFFDGELLCPTGVFAAPGSPVPVFLAQANLITGGLLLGLSAWHGALDATAISTILGLWALNCNAIQEPQKKSLDSYTLAADAFDKSRLSKSSPNEGGTIDSHPEFLLLPETPTSLPSGLTLTLKTQIFYLSPTSISALKELASPKNSAKTQSGHTWISTNTAISALVWKSVMAATYAHQLPVAFTDVLKTCSMMTSWAGLQMYDFNWGAALGGTCERVRTVASGMFNGLHVVLPELRKDMGGGLEIVVGLEDDAMERLKGDETWMRFAKLV